jgi:hypothetical protein
MQKLVGLIFLICGGLLIYIQATNEEEEEAMPSLKSRGWIIGGMLVILGLLLIFG